VDGASHQFLSCAGLSQDQHRCIGRSHHLDQSLRPSEGRAASDHLLEIFLDLFLWFVDALHAITLAKILYKSDPAERRELQHRSSYEYRNPGSIFPYQLFFKGSASSEPQALFVRQFIPRGEFRRSQIGPVHSTCQQIRAAISN
jgi:hypothetical protein